MKITVVPGGWGRASVADISAVLYSVQKVFTPCFGSDAMNQCNILVKRIREPNNPRCQRGLKTIYLNASDRVWSKFAYQFSHEYCHYQIPQDVPSNLRWFEESICELASYFFMPLISDLWVDAPPYPNWRGYAPFFREYAKDDALKATPFDLDFSSPDNLAINHLQCTEDDRLKNAYISLMLMPIFQRDPTLWHEVPLLCKIPSKTTFQEALSFWKGICLTQHQGAIVQIADVFSLSI